MSQLHRLCNEKGSDFQKIATEMSYEILYTMQFFIWDMRV